VTEKWRLTISVYLPRSAFWQPPGEAVQAWVARRAAVVGMSRGFRNACVAPGELGALASASPVSPLLTFLGGARKVTLVPGAASGFCACCCFSIKTQHDLRDYGAPTPTLHLRACKRFGFDGRQACLPKPPSHPPRRLQAAWKICGAKQCFAKPRNLPPLMRERELKPACRTIHAPHQGKMPQEPHEYCGVGPPQS
jgi:hypothetical protein